MSYALPMQRRPQIAVDFLGASAIQRMEEHMNFVNTISHDEQRLFTLLLIYYRNRERERKEKVSKKVLLTYIPDMTKDPTQAMTEGYMDQILGELMDSGYAEVESSHAESYYEVSDAGRDFLKENDLLIPSGRESILSRYLPEEELNRLLDAIADALNVQVGIMNENSESEILRVIQSKFR